ncbi:AAA family ATPase [Microbacter margulisiae]|uniref:Cytidylate kinase n=1 Tax=Microbacter margulisiae TaxID=1350067 RepID=A0A7W5DNY3_9PORP|nr:cytidylate kinase-like family protein [Microbacter margulisiae]MBB3186256.1 cytidylate kinase [Microbacter margulisiae]
MGHDNPFVITISRQLGSGGAYIGQQLAKKLDMYYADNEIINKAANKFSMEESHLASRDEKLQSIWHSFLQFSAFSSDKYIPSDVMDPTSRELYETETEIIRHIAKEHSAVIIGRCGFHILREYSNRVSIFLYGDKSFRVQRIQQIYEISDKEAEEMILQSDKERALYINTFTGKKWSDICNYDLAINTGKIGVDNAVELILDYVKFKQ